MKEQEMNKDYIDPRLSAGFNDYLPEESIPRQEMFDTIRGVFELYGFVPLETPGMERIEVLTGGDPNFEKEIFYTKLREGSDGLAMRFDLTVPLARVVARYPDIDKPFKRYQVGPVWRGERPQKGRYREFVQFDADIVGTDEMVADAEIIAVMYAAMKALGVKNFLIRVNNRKILNGLPEYIGFDPELATEAMRIIDKLDKIEWEGVSAALREELGFDDQQLGKLKAFIDLEADTNAGTVKAVRELMADSEVAVEGADELGEIVELVAALGVPDKFWKIDLSIARGMGYYTGPVFEMVLTDLPGIGSVCSGGRYDDLMERFSPVSVPAVGASIGVDRLVAGLVELGLLEKKKIAADVLVLNFDDAAKFAYQELATRLREGGVATEVYYGSEKLLKGQVAYAAKSEYPVVAIIGEDELKRGVVQLKDMKRRKQIEVSLDDVLGAVESILNEAEAS